MQIRILNERVANNGYRSRGGEPFDLSAEGETREEAMAKLHEPHPLAKFAGMFKDDPLFDNWQKSIAKYRREVDADPNYL